MPRRAVLRTSVLEDVLEQLGKADRAAAERAMDAAETLLAELEPAVRYPGEFVRWRLQGDREEDAESTFEEAIDGATLLRELAVFVGRLSERFPTDPTRYADGGLLQNAAAERLGITVRTLQRWRDAGLAFRWLTTEGSSAAKPSIVKLGVLNQTLARFLQRNDGRAERAASFSRMSSQEAERLRTRAHAMIEREGITVNEAARRVALESGRAHETLRQLLQHTTGESVVRRGVGARVSARERVLVLRAHDAGIEPSAIAEHISRSAASARRILAEARAERLRRLRPVWIELPVFAQRDATRVLLDAKAVVERPLTEKPLWLFDAPAIWSLLDTATAQGGPESLLLSAMHLQSKLAAQAIDSLTTVPSASALDQLETELRRADMLRRRVGECVFGAALTRVGQHLGSPLYQLPESRLRGWVDFSVSIVQQVINDFDPTARGELKPRLDRRVGLEADKQLALGVARKAEVDDATEDCWDPLAPLEHARSALGLAPWLIARLPEVSAICQSTLTARFGLARKSPQTIEQLRDEGESERSAHGRLRSAIRELRHVR
jgi:transposase